MKSILSYYFTLLFCLFPLLGYAQNDYERILNFDVEIKMNENRSIDVIERIEVYAKGNRIKRGITRGLPTRRYIEEQKYVVRYDDISIKRNGQKEPFHSKPVSDGKMLYIGKKDVFLPKGKHVYEIRYHVPNQIEWLDDFDRLRWNAIGTDVEFATDKARITITLPENTALQDVQTYVGKFGSTGNQDRVIRNQEGKSIYFDINDGLQLREGVTTSLQIEKGAILQPTVLEEKGSMVSILVASALLFFYFIFTWFRYGRDPKPSKSALLYDTPENLSPAAISYIQAGRYQPRALTSSIISLAVKGFIQVGNSDLYSDGKFVIKRLKENNNILPAEEYAVMNHLFSFGPTFVMDGKYNTRIVGLKQAHEKALREQHEAFIKEGVI